MIEHKNKNHLTEKDVFLYCDKEMDNKDVLEIEKHLENCKSCKQLVEKTLSFSKMLNNAAKNNLSVDKKRDCLSDMDISAYIDNSLSFDKKNVIEGHLSNCAYCLNIMAETKKSLEGNVMQKDIQSPIENIMPVIIQHLRKQKYKSLLEKFTEIVKRSPHDVQNLLGKINNDIENILNKTFAYPTPRFAPVFGEHKAKVLSPFGKVCYPIIFEWLLHEEADQYIVSIEDINWLFNTSQSRIEVAEKDIKLDYGKEHMWELKIFKAEEVIDEITGFFSLATEDEMKELMKIEKQFESIEPEQDNFILWAVLLEKREFYMEAIKHYKKAYKLEQLDGISYRIAYCYDKLELEELRDEWNRRILEQ